MLVGMMLNKSQNKSYFFIIMMFVSLLLTGCSNSPVRNPFEGSREPKVGALPAPDKSSKVSAKVVWTDLSIKLKKGTVLPVLWVDKTLYVASPNGVLAALDQDTGRPHWKIKGKFVFSTGPAYADGLLFVATKDAKVIAFDAQNGQERWQSKISTETLVTPKADQGIVLVNTIDGAL